MGSDFGLRGGPGMTTNPLPPIHILAVAFNALIHGSCFVWPQPSYLSQDVPWTSLQVPIPPKTEHHVVLDHSA